MFRLAATMKAKRNESIKKLIFLMLNRHSIVTQSPINRHIATVSTTITFPSARRPSKRGITTHIKPKALRNRKIDGRHPACGGDGGQ
jgi:hypothetical protein